MRILAEPYVPADACTVGDVARALDLTDEGVRHLVRDAQLPCTRTPAGWRLFRKGDVLWLANRRAEARLRGASRLRPKKQGLRGGPHQMSLFGDGLRPFVRRQTGGQIA
jgi:hypothetical protein